MSDPRRPEQPGDRPSRSSIVEWILTSSQRMRGRVVDPAVAAFADPARLAYGSWRVALRNDRRALAGTLILVVLAAMALYGALARPLVGHSIDALRAPSGAHWFGTDDGGRDVLLALMYGAYPTLGAAVLASLGAGLLGIALGSLGGFLRGVPDLMIQRTVEALTSIPLLLVVLIAQTLLPIGTSSSVLLIVVLTRWADVAQVVRADVLRVMQLEHVVAARALGAGPGRLLARHVIPSVLASAIVLSAFGVGTVIVVETAIAVVGIGHVHPLAWGAILGQARAHPEAWWLVLFPSGFVALTLGATVLLGEAIRDALDPRLRFNR
jgi:ABC-type dipeptide/oligopeptide/nickel transport system permease subunit